MLAACRLGGLSALDAHYADDNAQAQSGVEVQVREPPHGREKSPREKGVRAEPRPTSPCRPSASSTRMATARRWVVIEPRKKDPAGRRRGGGLSIASGSRRCRAWPTGARWRPCSRQGDGGGCPRSPQGRWRPSLSHGEAFAFSPPSPAAGSRRFAARWRSSPGKRLTSARTRRHRNQPGAPLSSASTASSASG
jgi:hypothetical protein